MSSDDRNNSSMDRFEDFLLGDDLTTDEVMRSLRRMGVKVDDMVERLHGVVQKCYSEQLKLEVQREQKQVTVVPSFLAGLASMAKEEMLVIFEKLARGDLGTQYQSAALARCRNGAPNELTDDELRSWLEDVGSIYGESGK